MASVVGVVHAMGWAFTLMAGWPMDWLAVSSSQVVSTKCPWTGEERLVCSAVAGLGGAGAVRFLALLPETWSVTNPRPLMIYIVLFL